MSAIDVLVLFLAAFGLAYVLGYSKISFPIRNFLAPDPPRLISWPALLGVILVDLIECPACLGVWEGFFFGLYTHQTPWQFFVSACAVSGSNFILGRLTRLM